MGGFGHVYLYQHLVSSSSARAVRENYEMWLWHVYIYLSLRDQESGEKMAVKLCRLELNSKNKERWSREIQIMKK